MRNAKARMSALVAVLVTCSMTTTADASTSSRPISIPQYLDVPSKIDPGGASSEESPANLTKQQEAELAALPISKIKEELVIAQLAADRGEKGAQERIKELWLQLPTLPTTAVRVPYTGPLPKLPMASTPTSSSRLAANPFVTNVGQVSQLQSNWCGPAVAYSLLFSLGFATSVFDGLALSQSNLSLPQYTGAGSNGGTDWADLDMQNTINKWVGVSVYVQNTPTTATNLFVKTRVDLDNGWVVPYDMFEIQNGPHYNNHPNRVKPIAHWTLATGYWSAAPSYGDLIYLNDPAANAPTVGWPGLNTRFWYGKNQAYASMVQQGVVRGIVY
jgi:hypothetical protein